MSKKVIKVENLTKQYRLGTVGTGHLYDDVTRWWYKLRGKEDPFKKVGEINDRSKVGKTNYVLALKDINFEVRQGELIGLIGKNGSGKSTLLKLLSKVTGPSSGTIKLKGNVASMLEVGTGFHPELSGRENIFLNGTIMGMTKREVKSKFDEIVEFAGIARYVETPVKRYSSGMTVRLAFAIAAHLEPEILLVDEVLAVGDAEFQNKCIGKMGEVSKTGRTIVFVSHNLGSIKKLCTSGIVLDNGEMKYMGSVEKSVDAYLESLPAMHNEEDAHKTFPLVPEKLFQFLEIGIEDVYRNSKGHFKYGENIFIHLRYLINDECRNFSVKITVARNGEIVFSSFDTDNDENMYAKRMAGEYVVKLKMPPYLKAGLYTVSIAFIELGVEKEDKTDVVSFILDDSDTDTTMKSYHLELSGMIKPKIDWAYFEHPVAV